MASLDTNCLLRWFLEDIPEHTDLITDIINSNENFTVADAAIIEAVFVLEKTKKLDRKTIEMAILLILETYNIICSRELFIDVLPVYTSQPKLSFVDCYLDALARKTGATPLLTLDKKMSNQLSGTKVLSS
jgi:predicted nucleic-acid-binding protein